MPKDIISISSSGIIKVKDHTKPYEDWETWTPLTSKDQLFMFVEKMREMGFNFNLNWQQLPEIKICIAQFHKISKGLEHGQGASENVNLAALQAAREALREKNPDPA